MYAFKYVINKLITFHTNSCPLIGQGHITWEIINNDIVPEQLTLCSKQLVSTGSGPSLYECHKLCC